MEQLFNASKTQFVVKLDGTDYQPFLLKTELWLPNRREHRTGVVERLVRKRRDHFLTVRI